MSHSELVQQVVGPVGEQISQLLQSYRPRLEPTETGTVESVSRGVVAVSGLPAVQAEELLSFPDGTEGMALDLGEHEVGVVLLSHSGSVQAGDEVRRTGRLLDVPVGDGLLGRVVDPLGNPLDSKGAVRWEERRPCERAAPAIMDRLPVTDPLQTGLKVVDALVPIGRGQRELIIGDRQTGKTAVAVDTILNQRNTGVICVYCAIGQRNTAVASVIEELKDRDALSKCVVVVAAGDEPPGLQYVAPFAATSIGEYFMEQGHDVLIVYDDLTTHARAYRELTLLLRRPPGREAFPGDIFYLHSRLLERSTHLCERLGGGSLTALVVAATESQNLSAYIPTNLISITDGQIYLSPELFQKGMLPAVDVGRSVSRVGGKTQLKAFRSVSGDLRLSYSQFEELEAFSRFSSRLDESTRGTLERGRRVREVLKQPQYATRSVAAQLIPLLAVTAGLMDEVDLHRIASIEAGLTEALAAQHAELFRALTDGAELTSTDRELLIAAMRAYLESEESDAGL